MTFTGDWEVVKWAQPPSVTPLRKPTIGSNAAQPVIVASESRVVVERDLLFDVRLFEHPYASTLQHRLDATSTAFMLEADTEYEDGGVRLPNSVVVRWKAGEAVALSAEARLLLRADQTLAVDGGGGSTVTLAGGMRLTPLAAVAVEPATRLWLRLLPQVVVSQESDGRYVVDVTAGMDAVVAAECEAKTSNAVRVKLVKENSSATLPSGSKVVLTEGTPVRFQADVKKLHVESSLRVPRLYQTFFDGYKPTSAVQQPYPVRDLDFSASGPYAGYNWELFYHIPLTIALHLSRNQRFAEAQQWLHHIFDPTDGSNGPTPERFWKVKPLQSTKVRKAEELLVNLASGGADKQLRKDTLAAIEAWEAKPFRPHLVAKFRQDAYMLRAVMAYLDNLIAWGDSLFARDTGESVDEALSHYLLAAAILGPRPQQVPTKGTTKRLTYNDIRDKLEKFGSTLAQLEPSLPYDVLAFPPGETATADEAVALRGIGKTLFFCVPRSEKMLRYWSVVADRLFKIHNSLNLQGVFRQLALFDPPIDPALLARAAAAGVDTAGIVAGLGQPLPLVRFQLLLAKANELCQDVKALGSGLLSAIEKEDGEAVAVLRSHHEESTLALSEQISYGRQQDAKKAREAVEAALNASLARFVLLQRQLNKTAEEIKSSLPTAVQVDVVAGIKNLKLDTQEPSFTTPEVEIDIAPDLKGAHGKIVSSFEAEELEKSSSARAIQDLAKAAATVSQVLEFIPDMGVDLKFWGLGGHAIVFGGSKIAPSVKTVADVMNWGADWLNWSAGQAAKIGGYARRQTELEMQRESVAHEITKTYKDLRAAEIREAVATVELESVQRQIANAAEVHFFLTGERTERWPKNGSKTRKTADLGWYTWMRRETRGLYTQCYQMAVDVSRKAQRALQHELGDETLEFISGGYAAGNEGLLAGERLQLDLRRMELAYVELNRRELELTKRVSLQQIDPAALIELRTHGTCSFTIPEALYDFGGAGQYFRRIKTVAVSIPAVVGDSNGVNCTLTLTKSRIRISPDLLDGDDPYARTESDSRFSEFVGVGQTIATSAPLNDSGMFEPSLRDERYLPFEYAGAESDWTLTLGGDPSQGHPLQFDYNTITDVVLHVRYTARFGGDTLRSACLTSLRERMDKAGITARLFSLRFDFPQQWAAMTKTGDKYGFSFTPEDRHFPFFWQSRLVGVSEDANNASLSGFAIVRGKDFKMRAEAIAPASKAVAVPGYTCAASFTTAKGEAVTDVLVIVKWAEEEEQ